MEDVLDLYAEPYDPNRPVVCFDETSTQFLADVRAPLPMQPGRPRREDYEYRRAGVRNIFLTCEPLAGWRHVAITQRRTMADVAYPQASVLPVVLDNSNIHRPASLYETFPPTEARRIVKRLEFHYTPKHASWLNMAEIEFGVLTRACLKGRHADEGSLARSIRACQNRRNAARATIGWRFGTQDARSKLHRLYPRHSKIDWTLVIAHPSYALEAVVDTFMGEPSILDNAAHLDARNAAPPGATAIGYADSATVLSGLVELAELVSQPLEDHFHSAMERKLLDRGDQP